MKLSSQISQKVIIYPNVKDDGIGRYVKKITELTGIHKSSESFELLSIRGLFKSLPINFPIVHVPHFVVPIFKRGIIVCTIQDLTPLVIKTELNLIKKIYIGLRIYISIRNSDYLIFTSYSTLNDAIRMFKRLPPHSVIPLGVEYSKLENTEKNTPLYTFPYFLCVGRRRAHKNIERILMAFSKIDELDNMNLIFLGKEDKYDFNYKKLAKELNIDKRVHFIGSVEEELLYIHYRQAVALLYPSLYEGFGLPILEAMANSCPVITSKIASMPEVSGDAALLVDPYNIKDMICAMERIASDKELRMKLITLGRVRARQYSWDKCANSTIKLYKELLNNHGL